MNEKKSPDKAPMGDAARQFIPRAPRYLLRADDNQIMRFAPNSPRSESHTTKLVNVSESGLAFEVQHSSAPRIGEVIKIEFAVPGGEQIAWFGKVVRLEEVQHHPWHLRTHGAQPDLVLVAIHFQQLPDGHRAAIRQHLSDKFHHLMQLRRAEQWKNLLGWLHVHGWQLIMYTLSILLTVAVLYMLSRPSQNYDSKRGAPWGQRFKIGF